MEDSLDKCWHLTAMARAERERANAYRQGRQEKYERAAEERRARQVIVEQEAAEKTKPPLPGIGQQVAHLIRNMNLTPRSAARMRPRARG